MAVVRLETMKATAILAMAALAAPAAAQDFPPIPGDYKRLAACVYRGLEAQSPGHWRLADLVDDIELTFIVTGGGLHLVPVKATFHKAGANVTTLMVEGYNEHYASKVRPLATECATRR
jgi:hypothetical protein